jgi:5'-3' exonuclease
MPTEIALIDLSSIAYPIWHTSASEPDPDRTSQQIVARVYQLTTLHARAAVCCDSGRSFRFDITPTYKANRPEHDAMLKHQIALAVERLKEAGYPIWSVAGFEADDLIATATTRAIAAKDMNVVIITGDKDLLQLVSPRVRAMSVRDGTILDADGVKAKFGVWPDQMRDYLTLVGDTSDNVAGVRGVGAKRAAELLAKFSTLESLYGDLEADKTTGITPSIQAALLAFKDTLPITRALITLRTDVPLPFEEIMTDRVSPEAEAFQVESAQEPEQLPVPAEAEPAPAPMPPPPTPPPTAKTVAAPKAEDLAVREPDILAPPPSEWERQLDPRSMREARLLAGDMYASRMFSAYGTPQAVLSTMMVGRELGLPAMASLRSIHNIEGKHALAASLMVALVLKSGLAEYFEPVSFSETEATFETHRKGARKPVVLTHTIEMATVAGLVKPNSNWVKVPTDMLVARAQARLCRMVYPDLLAGLYTPDELSEIRLVATTVAA